MQNGASTELSSEQQEIRALLVNPSHISKKNFQRLICLILNNYMDDVLFLGKALGKSERDILAWELGEQIPEDVTERAVIATSLRNRFAWQLRMPEHFTDLHLIEGGKGFLEDFCKKTGISYGTTGEIDWKGLNAEADGLGDVVRQVHSLYLQHEQKLPVDSLKLQRLLQQAFQRVIGMAGMTPEGPLGMLEGIEQTLRDAKE